MSNCSRRNFLKNSVLLGAAGMIGCSSTSSDSNNTNSSVEVKDNSAPTALEPPNTLAGKKVPTAVLGKTGVTVPILVHGGGYELNTVMVARALELGINYFDVADCYLGGQSEVVLGKTLQKLGNRKDVFIVSKYHPKNPADMIEGINGRLNSLQTDYLDAYYLHQLGDGEYPKDCANWLKSKEWKEVGERLKKEKKIKFFGFSCHAANLPEALEAAAEGGFIDLVMFRYNFRSVNSDALNRAIDKAKKANIGLVAMKTQGGRVSFQAKADGFKEKGFNQAQSTLKAVWSDGRIDTICSNMPSLQIVQENAMAALENQISEVERKLLDEYARETNHLVCHGCDNICSPHVSTPVKIGDTLRYLMYHDNYQDPIMAKSLYSKMSVDARNAILATDYRQAELACPHNLNISKMMADAAKKLA
ncbi:MAG: aldo/keto reductase [Acidobacteria bacterium]|nr:aldo/keto reductase [Acidobacteriota bacterium]